MEKTFKNEGLQGSLKGARNVGEQPTAILPVDTTTIWIVLVLPGASITEQSFHTAWSVQLVHRSHAAHLCRSRWSRTSTGCSGLSAAGGRLRFLSQCSIRGPLPKQGHREQFPKVPEFDSVMPFSLVHLPPSFVNRALHTIAALKSSWSSRNLLKERCVPRDTSAS